MYMDNMPGATLALLSIAFYWLSMPSPLFKKPLITTLITTNAFYDTSEMCQNLVSGIFFLILLLNHFVFTISLVIVKPPLQQVWQYSYFHLRTVHQLQPIYTCNADIHDNLAERELQEPLEHGVSD